MQSRAGFPAVSDIQSTISLFIRQIKRRFFVHLKATCLHEKMTGPTFDHNRFIVFKIVGQ